MLRGYKAALTRTVGAAFFFFLPSPLYRIAPTLSGLPSTGDASFEKGDVFVFGRESSGLPASILDPDDPRSLRLPTTTHVRSLNLATTVGITLYEQQRQLFGAATVPLRKS